jgi:hypothetical protein
VTFLFETPPVIKIYISPVFSLLSVKNERGAYDITMLPVCLPLITFDHLVDFMKFSREVMPLKVTSTP